MRATMMSNGEVKQDEVMARLITLAACDVKGKRLFNDDDWAKVNDLPLPPVLRIFRAAMELNNIADDDVEEIAGNSPATPNSSSG